MKYFLSLIVLVVSYGSSLAQIIITQPREKEVFQRNSNDEADIYVTGSFKDTFVTSVQIRLLNPSDSVVSGFDWKVIEYNPTNGVFQGILKNVPAGWYKLKVQTVKKNGAGSGLNTLVNRFGVGDVFAIAGQSNAQGYHYGSDNNFQYVGSDSHDERIVTHDHCMYCGNMSIPFPSFTQVLENTQISMNGQKSWLWGMLGDSILHSTNYPVAFFNYAAAGSSTQNWVETANGESTIHPFTNEPFCSLNEENDGRTYGLTEPYFNFKRGLNFYNSMYGARAVLWHQGESDKKLGVSQSTYEYNLNYIIGKSRTDYAANLPWMVARASYESGSPSSAVINAQNAVINPSNQIFMGPITDNMTNNTYPGSRDYLDLHFRKPLGFELVTQGWNDWITRTSFLQDANPIPANPVPFVFVSVNEQNKIVLKVPDDYFTYKWIRTDISGNETYEGTTSLSDSSSLVVTGGGTYRCWVVEENGNLQISTAINTENIFEYNSNGEECEENTYISSLNYSKVENSKGSVGINKTNGGMNDNESQTITLKGINHSNGLGVFGNSSISYILENTNYYKLTADLGISDNVNSSCTGDGVVFHVIADLDTLYSSPEIFRNSDLEKLEVNILGKREIKLVTKEVGGNSCNSAVWASPKLFCVGVDSEPPTMPENFVITDTLTRCLRVAWDASNDNIAVTGYELFLNGILHATVSAQTLSYTFIGLPSNSTNGIEVRAFDAADNYSTKSLISITLPEININYPGNGVKEFCVGTSYLPDEVIPKGGYFMLEEAYPNTTLNSLNGAFYTDEIDNFSIHYYIGQEIPGCEDETSIGVGTVAAPQAPIIASNSTLVNEGSLVGFEATTPCETGNTLIWSFSGQNLNPIDFAITESGTYYAECQKGHTACLVKSNEIEIKVLSDCYETLELSNPTDNLTGNMNLLKFNASETIKANNKLSPSANIEYNAGKSITLQHGFTVESGVIFKAGIKNCP